MFGKRQPVIVQIPQPCHQNWEQMQPAGNGRHCQSCQKIVTDFTNYTDAQIVDAITQSAGPVCGRFLNTHLNRNLLQPVQALPVIRPLIFSKIAATVLMFGAMVQQVLAQQKGNVTTQHQPTKPTNPKPATDTTDIVIRGKVLNYYNNTPVSGISIVITKTNYNCVTDVYGRFKFQLPSQFAGQKITIDAGDDALEFLDTTSSLVQPVDVTIDSIHFKTSVTLYRHPNENLSDTMKAVVVCASGYSMGIMIMQPPKIEQLQTLSPEEKANITTNEKIKNYFRLKLHNKQ